MEILAVMTLQTTRSEYFLSSHRKENDCRQKIVDVVRWVSPEENGTEEEEEGKK